MRTPHLLTAMSVFVAGVFGYALLAPDGPARSAGAAPPPAAAASPAPAGEGVAVTYDVTPLLRPAKDYLGVAITGAPQDMAKLDAFARRTGGKPNMVTIYESFDDRFAAAEARKIFQYGALPVIRWEPFKQSMADIAAGKHDAYVTQFATDVKTLNVPIVLTVAHEMNGNWYPWGTDRTRPSEFVAGWRHLHDVFERVGATNVIWTWTPNVVNYLRHAPLRTFWPGASYVDWVGIDGYFTHRGQQTYSALFNPTLREVRRIARKPVLIVETGSEPGDMRPEAVDDLFTNVAEDRDVIGFVYFNQRGSANWVIDADQRTLRVFRDHDDRADFGFPVQ